ncbi:MAG: gamma-glutamylcyclotransferase [Rhodospirillaceae bacterium]
MDARDTSTTWGPGTPQRLTPKQKQAGIARILAERPKDGPFRLFAFGSLMWNPECTVVRAQPATVHDFERRFQIWSTRARGCVERPGLGLCLLPVAGGQCRGLILELDEDKLDSDLKRLWDREQNSGVYRPTWITAMTDDGAVPVMTFVVTPEHPHFVPEMPHKKMAEIMCKAAGTYGTNHDYVINLIAEMKKLGVDDPALHDLEACIRARLSGDC